MDELINAIKNNDESFFKIFKKEYIHPISCAKTNNSLKNVIINHKLLENFDENDKNIIIKLITDYHND